MIPPLTSQEHFRARVWLALIAALVIFESSCSRVALPEHIFGIDKIGHFLLYGLLATHFHRAGFTKGRLWLSILAMSLFGASDELHQHFTPGRTMDVYDWLSDTLGSALAIALHDHFRSYRRLLDWRIA
jgi:VanZ family protein